MMLNKMTHDNIRYAGNIHDFAEVYLENWGAELRDEQKECLEEIRHQSVLLQEYLKDLRRIMSILAKRMQGQYEMGVYDLRELTRQVLQAESARAQQNGVSLCLTAETENAKESCLGWGERDSVRHVIENLIGNALKFTPRGGTVSAGVKDLGDTLEFTVTDTGPGIPPESLPHIFELFYQGKGREEMSQSTGLGLSIVKEIVALHGGNIDVITEIGQGTTFFVRLPSEKARPDKRAA